MGDVAGQPAGSAARADSAAGGTRGAVADRALDAVLALFDAAGRYVDRLPHAVGAGLRRRPRRAGAARRHAAPRAPEGDAVRLLTAHASKGLEWELVFVAGVQEGVWPDLRLRGVAAGRRRPGRASRSPVRPGRLAALRPAGRLLAEERRLFYVAVTRAPRAARGHRGRGRTRADDRPSRFLEELGVGAAGAGQRAGRPLTAAAWSPSCALVAATSTDPALREAVCRRLGLPRRLADEARAHVAAASPDRWWGLAPLSDDAPLVGERRDRAGLAEQGRDLRHLLAALVPRERGRRVRAHRPARRWSGRSCTPWPSSAGPGRARRAALTAGSTRCCPSSTSARRGRSGAAAQEARASSSGRFLHLAAPPTGASSSAPSWPFEVAVGRAGRAVRSGRPARARRRRAGASWSTSRPAAASRRRPSSPATRSSPSTSSPSRSAPSPSSGLTEPGGAALLQLQTGKTADEQLQAALSGRRRARLGAGLVQRVVDGMSGSDFPATVNALHPHLRGPRQLPGLARGRRGASGDAPDAVGTAAARRGAAAGRSATSRPRSSPRPLEAGVVVAGAGSGKTATMVARVVWLVGTGRSQPEQVLGLTFTSKAADELAVRVRLGPAPAARRRPAAATGRGRVDLEPTVSTYHAYAARLVRDHALRIGREPGARLVTPATSWQLAARAVAAYDGPMERRRPGPSRPWSRPCWPWPGTWPSTSSTPSAVRERAARLDGMAATATSSCRRRRRKVLACQPRARAAAAARGALRRAQARARAARLRRRRGAGRAAGPRLPEVARGRAGGAARSCCSTSTRTPASRRRCCCRRCSATATR